MNADDLQIAKRWNEAGFVHFGRIAACDIKKHGGVARDYWCVLSEEAWRLAHAERRARCERVMATLKVQRTGLPVAQAASASLQEGDVRTVRAEGITPS